MQVEDELKKIYEFLSYLETDVILHNPPVQERIKDIKKSMEQIAIYIDQITHDMSHLNDELSHMKDEISQIQTPGGNGNVEVVTNDASSNL